MLYCTACADYPVEYISCGNLVSNDGFVHSRRNIDSFVFIIVCEGTLHINQNGQNFDIHENESMLLFPNQTHYGYKPSTGRLSYYWVHFFMTDPHYTIYTKNSLLRHNQYLGNDFFYPPLPLQTVAFSFQSMDGSLLKNVLFFCLFSCLIFQNVPITRSTGIVVMH